MVSDVRLTCWNFLGKRRIDFHWSSRPAVRVRFFHYVAFVISSVTVWTCEVISWRANIYCSVNYSSKKKKKKNTYRTLEKSDGFTNFVQVPLHYADRSFKLRKYCCCFNNSASFPERLFGIFLIGVYFFQVMF